MHSVYTLASLPVGKSAVIQDVPGRGAIYERLTDLGFSGGGKVTCLFASLFGDPRAYKIKNSVIALRKCDACRIMLRPGGGEA